MCTVSTRFTVSCLTSAWILVHPVTTQEGALCHRNGGKPWWWCDKCIARASCNNRQWLHTSCQPQRENETFESFVDKQVIHWDILKLCPKEERRAPTAGKRGKFQQFPTKLTCFRGQIQRAHLTSSMWKRAWHPIPQHLDPVEYRWTLDDGHYKMHCSALSSWKQYRTY